MNGSTNGVASTKEYNSAIEFFEENLALFTYIAQEKCNIVIDFNFYTIEDIQSESYIAVHEKWDWYNPKKGTLDSFIGLIVKDRLRDYKLNDGSAVPEGEPVRDYYNMVADLGRREGVDRADYYVATKGRVIRFQVVFGESRSRTLKVEDLGGGGEQSLSLQLRRMDLTPWNEDPKDIGGLFAMKGGTEIWLEAETGMLAVIAGEMPGVPGRTEILLKGARFEGLTLSQALSHADATGTTASP